MAAAQPALAQSQATIGVVSPPRKLGSRVPTGMWVTVIFALITFVGIVYTLNNTKAVPVAVSTRALVAGEPVKASDFRFVNVEVDGTLDNGLLRAADIPGIAGHQAVRSIPAGALIAMTDLVDPGAAAAPRALSVPVDASHAVGGALQRGDTVDIIDSSGVEAVYVVAGAKVLDVGSSDGSKLGSSNISSHYSITVTVDSLSALRVATAIAAGKIEVVRSTGAPAIGQ